MQVKQLLLKLKSFGVDITALQAKDVELEDQIKALKEQVGNLDVSEAIKAEIEAALTEFEVLVDEKIAVETAARELANQELDGKITSVESEVNLLKTTIGASANHIIVNNLEELEAAKESNNHATIAHVIETKETYILEKDSDVNGNQVTPEWIKLSDTDALLSVDWNIIQNKPFSSVAEGLIVEGEALKVSVDNNTLEIKEGKVSVKDNVFAELNHTHDFNEILNKPVAFTQNYVADDFIEGTEGDAELFYITVSHGKGSKNINHKVIGSDNVERFVGVEYTDENTVTIWTDVKEDVTVIINCFDYSTPSAI